jgi:hypothetical protein
MSRNFILETITNSTKDRLEELRFLLIIKTLKKSGSNIYTDNIIESICQFFNIRITNIHYAIGMLETTCRPKPLELGLLNQIFKIQMRTICFLSHIASKTIYDALDVYINKEFEYPLVSQFGEEVIIDIKNFNDGYRKLFQFATHLV